MTDGRRPLSLSFQEHRPSVAVVPAVAAPAADIGRERALPAQLSLHDGLPGAGQPRPAGEQGAAGAAGARRRRQDVLGDVEREEAAEEGRQEAEGAAQGEGDRRRRRRR